MTKQWARVGAAMLLGASAAFVAPEVSACGGFFCGQLPVDQTSERILFEVGSDSVTMTTQISFNGDAADFAWILPLPAVPDPDSLEVFPLRALTALDVNTGPVFLQPDDPACWNYMMEDMAMSAPSAGNAGPPSEPPPVTVHIRAQVGEYDVAVVESDDYQALVTWLRDNAFRVTAPMVPYIKLYTAEGMKFLALRLLNDADVKDLSPFRFALPGTVPSIPLRMTALAAEPEMSIVVFVMGREKFGGKNWDNLEIDDGLIRFNPNDYGQTNWTSLVAKAVDDAGGQGWVTEFSGPTADYAARVQEQLANANFGTPEDEVAAQRLHDVLAANPYMTRLYTRVSAEEMTSDPIFGRTERVDVAREHQMERFVEGEDQCTQDPVTSTNPCDFSTCGKGGLCRPVMRKNAFGSDERKAACGCVPGATARTTFAPDGSTTVICQDKRLSFLNPGDKETAEAQPLPDPCATFNCGTNGHCVAMNMTPTCECNEGFVAVGDFDAEGRRKTECVEPDESIPSKFYLNRLPALPEATPGGRAVETPEPSPTRSKSDGGLCSVGSGGGDSRFAWLSALGLVAAAARRRRAASSSKSQCLWR